MEKMWTFLSLLLIQILSLPQNFALPPKEKCPDVRRMENFNIFDILGSWFVVQYYSSSEEALTYHCMRAEFGLSQGYMDMIMKLTYMYADDPGSETQTGNMTWQIPDPRRPEHWRHTENPYKGVYNTDVIDTDYSSWLILLHCSDPESEKKFLSTFVLSRTAYIDRMTTDYLREKIGQYHVPMEYLFPVNQTYCFGESSYVNEDADKKKEHAEQLSQPTTIKSTTEEGLSNNLEESEQGDNNDDNESESAYNNGDGESGGEPNNDDNN